ncbi:MAG: alpha-L-fucosidase [Eubacteriales bacterium]|nr:alpha-L-fucosidase [Eubacteriales bacterium]
MDNKWYDGIYRRNLVDMHIEDWNPEFLSRFSVEDYFENLKRARIQSPMIYLQSHVGHCYWPTRSGHMHAALSGREDMIRRLIRLCRDNGMKAVGYYSLIYNTWAEKEHPEWRIHGADGKSPWQKGGRYGLCCPNNAQYRQFVFAQLKEISEYFELDGMFYDMLFWAEICRCDACAQRFMAETGMELPPGIDWYDNRWNVFVAKRAEWMGEFAMTVTTETKRLMPRVSVEHNYASGVAGDWFNGASEAINEACDYTGGDLYGDLYNHSFVCKYYMNITKNQPFEYMTCRCDASLHQHTVTKTEAALTNEVLLTCAHHGASLIIDAIDPAGTLDHRVYERIGNVFEKQMRYESWFRGEMTGDFAVYYNTMGRYNPDGQSFTNKSCAINTIKTLIENHVPCGVLSNGCMDRIKNYKLVLAPSICGLTEKNIDALADYVRGGGCLYFSGAYEPRLLRELLGAEYLGLTEEKHTYLAPAAGYEYLFGEFSGAYPMPFDFRLPKIKISDGGIAARITLPYTLTDERPFASIHSDPPGKETDFPALVIRRCGAGRVIWSAASFESDSRYAFKRLLMSLAFELSSPESLSLLTTASKKVELVIFDTGGSKLISAVDLDCDEELRPHMPFVIKVKSARPVSVRLLPDNTPVEFKYDDGYVCFTARKLIMFDMYEILL